jgi:hypothetical protein
MGVKNESRWARLESRAVYLRDIFARLKHSIGSREIEAMIARNAELRNRHKDRTRCFVIGNGPSLKTQDLRLLKDEITIVANSFFKHPDHAVVSPLYCCVGDHSFVEDQPNCIAWLREIETKLPRTNLLFPPEGLPLFRKHHLFEHHQVYYVQRLGMVDKPEHVRLDFSRPTNVGHSTGSSLAIPLALYLGFREIYLIGFDSNWLGTLEQSSVHFYDTNPYYPHFDKALVPGESFEDQFWTCFLEFKSHRLLRDKAKLMGARIMNATNGGWLDMYPRVSFERLFEVMTERRKTV